MTCRRNLPGDKDIFSPPSAILKLFLSHTHSSDKVKARARGGRSNLASSRIPDPSLQLCGKKAWYRLHAHARAFCKICRIRIRTDIMGLYVYGQFYGKVYGNLTHGDEARSNCTCNCALDEIESTYVRTYEYARDSAIRSD